MEPIVKMFEFNFSSILISVFVVIAGLKAMCALFEWAVDKLGIEFRFIRKKREDHELLITTAKNLAALQEKHEEDVTQSIRHDKLIKEDLLKVSQTVDKISDKLDVMVTKSDATEKARLKDRIAQAYRRHHESGEWTRIDKEAYEGLIQDYEAHGGKNSFVHEICEPESYTWKIID